MVYPEPPAILKGRNLRSPDLDNDPSGALFLTYAWMQAARTADNRILDLFRQGLIRGTVTGLTAAGALVLEIAPGVRREIVAGDVHLER